MDLIDRLPVQRVRGSRPPGMIQLLHGDLAAIPEQHTVDVLVVSAFPNSYTPNPGTLFESLFRQGLDMQEVAAAPKAEDDRDHLGCWLSQQLPGEVTQRLHFSRILCFEPRHPQFVRNSGIKEEAIQDSVAFVFRCLNHFIIPDRERKRDFHISSVAMPLLATGNQRVPVEALFPRLLDAAVFWLEQGLPIDLLNIVAFKPSDVVVARAIFQRTKSVIERRPDTLAPERVRDLRAIDWEARLAHIISRDVIRECQAQLRDHLVAAATDDERAVVERVLARVDAATPAPQSSAAADPPDTANFDVFISYAHKQEREVKEFVEALKQHVPAHKIFFDRTSIPAGGQWIRMLSDAVEKTRTFVALLSPEYTASPVCWDEFQCAKLAEYNTRQSIIKTIRLYSEPKTPAIMGIHSYIDCAEGDLPKLRECAAAFAS